MPIRIRIGFIPMGDAEQASARIAELAEALSVATEAEVVAHRASDYRGLVAALEQGAVQVAWVPPLIAARAVRAGTIVPIAVSVRSGATSYSAALIAREGGRVQTTADLRGVRAAWVDRESASGYLAIRMALRASGLSLVDAFAEETFARSHTEVARLVATAAVDVGATYLSWSPDCATVERAGWLAIPGVDPKCIRVVVEAGPIPSDMFAVHSGLRKAVVQALETALIDGRPRGARRIARQLTQSDGFVRPTRDHLAMLEALGATQDTSAGPRK
jgi:phosphonate transport system substrate-binding protein